MMGLQPASHAQPCQPNQHPAALYMHSIRVRVPAALHCGPSHHLLPEPAHSVDVHVPTAGPCAVTGSGLACPIVKVNLLHSRLPIMLYVSEGLPSWRVPPSCVAGPAAEKQRKSIETRFFCPASSSSRSSRFSAPVSHTVLVSR